MANNRIHNFKNNWVNNFTYWVGYSAKQTTNNIFYFAFLSHSLGIVY